MEIFVSQKFIFQTIKNLIVLYLKKNSINMNYIVSEKFNSSNDLLAAMETWSLTYNQPINIRSSNLLSNEKLSNGSQRCSKVVCEQFQYKRIVYKCINGGVVRAKQDKTRCTQSNNIFFIFILRIFIELEF